MTIRDWWGLNPAQTGYWRDCEIINSNAVSDRFVLITVQIPLPMGGEYYQIVPMDEEIEVRENG